MKKFTNEFQNVKNLFRCIRMKFFIVFSLLFVGHSIFGQTDSILKEIDEYAFEISNTDSNLEFENSLFLQETFKNRKIFGFGEATHSTKEFFDLKLKFLKYLVKNHGVNVFAIEASFGNCLAIDNYIKNGVGNPRVLIGQMGLWIWNTEEVFNLVEWMKDYNINKESFEKISFVGIDIMDCSKSVELLLGQIESHPEKYEPYYSEVIKHYSSKEKVRKMEKKTLVNDLKVLKELDNKLELKSSKLLKSIIYFIEFKLDYSQETRDRLMFENINNIMNNSEGNRVFVWSHNFHIKKTKITYTNDFSMGHFLKEKYGNEYYSIGFDFGVGNFYAYDMKTKKIEKFTVDEPLRKSASELFYSSSMKNYFLDFNTVAKSSSLHNFINLNIKNRGIGSNYNPKLIFKEHLNDAYDGIIFVKTSSVPTYLREE